MPIIHRSEPHATQPANDDGFTLIELMVAILIIGVLAGIAVVTFFGQQTAARDSAAIADLAHLRLAMVSYSVANDGAYTSDLGDLTPYGFGQSTAATPVITLSLAGFCAQLTSDSATTFFVTDSDAPAPGTCTID